MSNNDEWNKTKESANILLFRFHPQLNDIVSDPVKTVYDNQLPMAVKDLLAECFVHDLDKSDRHVLQLVNAYQQIKESGFIGAVAEQN